MEEDDYVKNMLDRGVIEYNVGGRPVDVAIGTIQLHATCVLAVMLSHPETLKTRHDGRIFIDWHPDPFEAMIHAMRTSVDPKTPCLGIGSREWQETLRYFGFSTEVLTNAQMREEENAYRDMLSHFTTIFQALKWHHNIVDIGLFSIDNANPHEHYVGVFSSDTIGSTLFVCKHGEYASKREGYFLGYAKSILEPRFNLIGETIKQISILDFAKINNVLKPGQSLEIYVSRL